MADQKTWSAIGALMAPSVIPDALFTVLACLFRTCGLKPMGGDVDLRFPSDFN